MKNFFSYFLLTFCILSILIGMYYYQSTHQSFRVIENDLNQARDSLYRVSGRLDSLNRVYIFYTERLEVSKLKLRIANSRLSALQEEQFESISDMKALISEIQAEVDTSYEEEDIELFLFK